MRIRRLLTALVATAAFTGLGFTGAASAGSLTPGECLDAGGTIDRSTSPLPTCRGGSLDGQTVD